MAKSLGASVRAGSVKEVERLLTQGADPRARDSRGTDAVRLAVRKGSPAVLEALLKGGATIGTATGYSGRGYSEAAELLLIAASASNRALVDCILEAVPAAEQSGVLQQRDDVGWAVLHAAAKAGCSHLVACALQAGATPDEPDGCHGATPLMVAVQHGHVDVVRTLIAARSPEMVCRTDLRGWSALHWASQGGDVGVLTMLLDARAALEVLADGVGTPMMVAAENAHPDVVAELLARGAVVDASDVQGWTTLSIAASKGNAPIVSQLVEARADVNKASTNSQRTALMAGAQNGHAAAASLLLAARADPNAKDRADVTALMLAVKNGHQTVAQLLLEAGARPDATDAAGQTALILNAREGNVAIAHLLLRHGARADHETRRGATALSIAARHSHRGLIEVLLRSGTARAGELLMAAAASAQMDELLALVKAGGGLVDVDVLGSALLVAAAHGHRAVVTVLVNAGASVFKQDAAGLSPLMIASAAGHVEAVRALIKSQAPVNAPGGPGANTALSLAVRNGKSGVVAELLRNGANVEWRGSSAARTGADPAGLGTDLLDLAHDPQVKAQLVAERQRRNLERELLAAAQEATARKARRTRAAPTTASAAHEDPQQGQLPESGDIPAEVRQPGVGTLGVGENSSAAANLEPLAAGFTGGLRDGRSATVEGLEEDPSHSQDQLTVGDQTDGSKEDGRDEEEGVALPAAVIPDDTPTPIATARFCRACGVMAFRGHRCKVGVSDAARSRAAEASGAAKARPAYDHGLGHYEPVGPGRAADSICWRSPATCAGSSSKPLSLEALAEQTATTGDSVRLSAAVPRRAWQVSDGHRESTVRQLIDMQMESIRAVEQQLVHEKRKLQLLLDLQDSLGASPSACSEVAERSTTRQ